MYLNDDFEGGEISFSITDYTDPHELPGVSDNYNIAKETKEFDFGLKPKAGSTVIFPSSPPYRHTAHSVIDGYKYIVQLPWLYTTKETGE